MAFHSLNHRAPPVAGSSRNIAHQRKHHCKPVTELERCVFSPWGRKLGKFQSPKRFTQRPRNRSIPSRSQSRWRKRGASHSTRWAGPTSSHRLRNTHRLSNPGSNSSSAWSWLVGLSLFSRLLKPSHLSGEGFFCLPHHPQSDLFHCMSSWVQSASFGFLPLGHIPLEVGSSYWLVPWEPGSPFAWEPGSPWALP